MRPPGPLGAASRQLAALSQEIAQAQATLDGLRAAIDEARSELGLASARAAHTENARLVIQNRLVTERADTADVALEAAVKVSQTDSLTGAHNREVLWDRIAHNLALVQRNGGVLAIYFLDVNGFKKVNDEFGHAIGDLVLKHVARVLTTTVRASDTVCRIGGDEFVVVATAARRDDVEQLATKIASALSVTCTFAGHAMDVSASVGFSLYPDDGQSPGVLVHKADEAMYRMKRALARRV